MLKNSALKFGLVLFLVFCGLFVVTPQTTNAHHCLGHADGSEQANGTIAECLDAGACLDTQGQGGNCQDEGTLAGSVNGIVATVINLLSVIVGIVSVIMIIIGGLKYITSSGDSANVTSAKNTILYAVIGLVVVAFAQILVRFVLEKSIESQKTAISSSVGSSAEVAGTTGNETMLFKMV